MNDTQIGVLTSLLEQVKTARAEEAEIYKQKQALEPLAKASAEKRREAEREYHTFTQQLIDPSYTDPMEELAGRKGHLGITERDE